MDPGDGFSANIFKWDPRGPQQQPPPSPCRLLDPPPSTETASTRELAEVFQGYGVRYLTVARIGELGFTASTLVGMRDEELDDMMATVAHLFRWDLLVGERYGVKAAVRAERRRLDALILHHRHFSDEGHVLPRMLMASSSDHHNAGDALSQEGLSEEPVQQERREAAGSGGEAATKNTHRRSSGSKKNPNPNPNSKEKSKKKKRGAPANADSESEWDSGSDGSGVGVGSGSGERQREHPFIVTEPGEVARAKKNGLDYLFHLYEQCREFLLQVQSLAKERGDKCPTKVTNQVFRYAKKVGASYINKPKMRHYVHCYALHCLDEDASNALRRDFKHRGENVGAWRQACYKPLVSLSARYHGWDIDAVFAAHPRLSIWYVPTKLRHLCHLARSNAAAAAASGGADGCSLALPPSMF